LDFALVTARALQLQECSSMGVDVRVISSSDRWTVALDGRNVVGFYGPDARLLAERHRDELAELLDARDTRAELNAGRPTGDL
jgi:hypothetical protein